MLSTLGLAQANLVSKGQDFLATKVLIQQTLQMAQANAQSKGSMQNKYIATVVSQQLKGVLYVGALELNKI